MIVQLKRSSSRHPDLSVAQRYLVIGVEADDLRLLNDQGRPYLYPAALFKVVEDAQPDDWIETRGDEGERYAYPRPLHTPGFFEDFFDGKPGAVAAFWHTVNHRLATPALALRSARHHDEPRRRRASA